MSSHFDRQRSERLARAIREKKIREARALQSNPKGGLYEFVKYFWKTLEPVDEFVDGWAIEALCAHLEGITNGETIVIGDNVKKFNRLLANVPPGFSKSLTTNVFWPAYEWGPRGLPHLRYLSFSYSPELTQRDNAKFRDLITSQEYRALWGHVFEVVGDGKIRVTNDKTGFKFATSTGGVGTGERGHRVLCFPGGQVVATEHGDIAIEGIVNNRMETRVASLNRESGRIEMKPVIGWRRNPGREIVEIRTEDGGSIRCTYDHKMYSSRGIVPALFLCVGDSLLAAPRRVGVAAPSIVWPKVEVEVLPAPAAADARNRSARYAELFRQDLGAVVMPGGNLPDHVLCEWRLGVSASQVEAEVLPRATGADVVDCPSADAKLFRESFDGVSAPGSNLTNQIVREMARPVLEGAVSLGVGDVLGARPIFEVVEPRVSGVPVFVSNFAAGGRGPEKGKGNKAVHLAVDCLSVDAESDARVALDRGPGHNLAGDSEQVGPLRVRDAVGARGAALWPSCFSGEALDATEAGNLVDALGADNRAPFFVRITAIEFLHEIPHETYCLTVADNGNMVCGTNESRFVTSNCDDPHKIKATEESDEARAAITNWVQEGMQNRLNDLERDAIVIIMQRVHEADSSGVILKELSRDYCHLAIPMEYEPGRHFSHYAGWNGGIDPRTEDGELAWPERYPANVMASFKKNAYLWSGQYQQTPTPRGGGLFKEAWWNVHEVRRMPQGGLTFVPEVKPIFVLASLDTAFSEKEEADFSALSVWIAYDDPVSKQRRIMLADAWQKRLPELSGERVERRPDESEAAWRRRAQPKWGLAEWVAYTCQRRRVNRLIVENKNRAPDVIRVLRKHFQDRDWGIQAVDIRGDKWGRANAVVDLFTDGMIHAPAEVVDGNVQWLEWADEMIREVSVFPRGQHDDLVDSMTMALKYLRDNGLAIRRDEAASALRDALTHKGSANREAIYPV